MAKLNEVIELQLKSIEKLSEIMSSVLDRQQDLDLRLRQLETRLNKSDDMNRKAMLSLAQSS